jgi:hypothetical protein
MKYLHCSPAASRTIRFYPLPFIVQVIEEDRANHFHDVALARIRRAMLPALSWV